MAPSRPTCVIGGGILGLAFAREVLLAQPGLPLTLFEKDPAVGQQQSGRNSGVVHAGLYYRPGSLKARLCREGADLAAGFAADHGIAFDRCGKLVVATTPAEEARLTGLLATARANGVPGVRLIGSTEILEHEPEVEGRAALLSPVTAITDFGSVCRALAAEVERLGGEVRTASPVTGIVEREDGVEVRTPTQRVLADRLVVCSGLQSDRLARLAGGSPWPAIVPFRGGYYALREDRRHLVRGLVYPVPDPRYPFLGIHLTRRVDGGVLVGPNAVVALAREGYRWRDVQVADVVELARSRAFRALARRHLRTGVAEVARSLSRRSFARAARRYVPALRADDLVPAPAGVRAQAVTATGQLVDDFVIDATPRVLVVRNAPSPAATSSLAIARHLRAQWQGMA